MAPDPVELFEILVREHSRDLELFLRSVVRDPELVDDLYQETLLVAWRRLDDFDRARSFGAWLRGIARNLAFAARRNHGRSGVLVEDDVLEALDKRFEAFGRLPGDDLDERLELLERCMEELTDRSREAVRLRYEEELDTEQVAEQTASTVFAVRKILLRARERLGECFDRRLSIQGGAA